METVWDVRNGTIYIEVSYSGSTTDFDSVSRGPTPRTSTIKIYCGRRDERGIYEEKYR